MNNSSRKSEYIKTFGHGSFSSFLADWASVPYTLGKVLSKYQSSLDLAFSDRLIHVGGEGHGLCCFGMTLSENAVAELLSLVETGDIVRVKAGNLDIYTKAGPLRIEVSKMRCVDTKIPALTELGMLWDRLSQREGKDLPGLEMDGLLEQIFEALSSEDSWNTETQKLVSRLSGRGLGLTPSGDDILVGYGALLQAAFAGGKDARILQRLEEVRKLKFQTTKVSLAYLDAMLQGFANAPFCELILAAESRDIPGVDQKLEIISETGHTSGADTLFGMRLGMKFLFSMEK